jgi:hypothetical protein
VFCFGLYFLIYLLMALGFFVSIYNLQFLLLLFGLFLLSLSKGN